MVPQFSASHTDDINENSSSSITGQSDAARVAGCEEEFLGAMNMIKHASNLY